MIPAASFPYRLKIRLHLRENLVCMPFEIFCLLAMPSTSWMVTLTGKLGTKQRCWAIFHVPGESPRE